MLKIPASICEAMIEHAKKSAPLEACGYLAGQAGEVKKHFAMTNVDSSAEHFSFNPEEQFAVLKEATKGGLRLIACYHSHPVTPARPSEEDIKLAYDPNISYVIISLANGKPDIKSFQIKSGKVDIEDIEVQP